MTSGRVCVFIANSLTVLKEVTFQDRAMDVIHKLSPRLYRFTKIPYAQCTLLKKSESILWKEELKDELTYNVCFHGICWVGMPPAIQKPTLWGPGSDFYVDTGRLFTSSKNTAPLCNMKPANCFSVRSPVGSIAIVLFSLSVV